MARRNSNTATPNDNPGQREPAHPKPRTKRADPSSPKYPYTQTPGALRTFLKAASTRPLPQKIDQRLLKSWDINDNNATTITRVLDAIGLTSGGVPTQSYTDYMNPTVGPAILAKLIKITYKELFEASHEPFKDDATLNRLLNIHGGTQATSTLRLLRETFKALCEFADFAAPAVSDADGSDLKLLPTSPGTNARPSDPGISFVINLHIHLPEGRSRRDYENMIEDIGKYLMRMKGDLDE